MLTSFSSLSFQGHPNLTFIQRLGYISHNCKMVYYHYLNNFVCIKNLCYIFGPFRELQEARVQQSNPPQRKIGLGSQVRNSRVLGQKVNRSMSLSVIM